MSMRLDSHQHFWIYDPKEYGWMKPGWSIRRNYLPADLAPELRACGLDGCVAVQARQSLEESRWLLELADHSPMVKGVVGWVDLRAENVADQLAPLARHPKFVGVRHVAQDEADDEFLLRPDFKRGIARLREFDLKYDLLVFPRQLPAAIGLARAFPDQPFVLDHIAKPPVREGLLSPWREQIRELAALPNVVCKVSGMITEADWERWRPADFEPYLDTVFGAFGPDRLMYGSDWPVALLAGTYRQMYELARDYFSRLGVETEAKVFGCNAAKFYGI
jgi:L-fuconolactonase